MKSGHFSSENFRRMMLVLGVTLLPAAACAQSSVVLYGTLDSGLMYTSKSLGSSGQSTGKQFEYVSSGMLPSLFGLTGQEDLGAGLKLSFDLESGISLANGGFDNNNGNFFGRQAWIALSNHLGELKAGLQYSPFRLALYDADARSMIQFASNGTVAANNSFTSAFNSNAISYTSPSIAGFTASVMYKLGGVPGNFQAGREYSASLKFEYEGFLINAAIADESNSSDQVLNSTFFSMPFEGRMIGMAYKFGALSIKGSFSNHKAPPMTVDGIQSGGDNNIWNIGFDYAATSYLDVTSGVWYIKDPHESSNHALIAALGANYALSKRTSLYVQMGVTNNHGREAFGLDVDGDLQNPTGTTFGGVIGVSHSF